MPQWHLSQPTRRCPCCWSSALITFYYNLAPNPMKVALCLEEMGLPYELKPVDTRKGEQHQPDFLAINPNGKVPVIIDQDTGARVFDSNAILLYLAERTGQFLPDNTPVARGELLSWLMFIATGVGPFSGQAVISSTLRLSPRTMPSTVICTKPDGTTASLMRVCPSSATWWVRLIRSWT